MDARKHQQSTSNALRTGLLMCHIPTDWDTNAALIATLVAKQTHRSTRDSKALK